MCSNNAPPVTEFLHHNRVLYVLEPTPEALDARNKKVTVLEDADGAVTIWRGGKALGATPFDKVPRAGAIEPGAVVSHKLLGAALGQIQQAQEAEERERLKSARTRREREDSRRRLREA